LAGQSRGETYARRTRRAGEIGDGEIGLARQSIVRLDPGPAPIGEAEFAGLSARLRNPVGIGTGQKRTGRRLRNNGRRIELLRLACPVSGKAARILGAARTV